MSSATPTYAYVAYKDGAKAILHVSLINDYHPSSLSDLAKNKSAYWCSRGEKGSTDEGFYDANVVELGVTMTELIQRLAKRKIAVPDNIFEDAKPKASSAKKKATSPKSVARNVATAKRRKMTELLSQRDMSTSEDDEDDDVVPKKLLTQEQEKVASLRQKLQALREDKKELQERHDRLEDMLLNKLEAWFASQETENVPFSQDPSLQLSPAPSDAKPVFMSDDMAVPGTSTAGDTIGTPPGRSLGHRDTGLVDQTLRTEDRTPVKLNPLKTNFW